MFNELYSEGDQKVVKPEIFQFRAGGCSAIRDADLCLSLLFARAFACRDHLML